jgi:hypothetical protein
MKVNIIGFKHNTTFDYDTRKVDFVFDLDDILRKSLAVLYEVPENYFEHTDIKNKNVIYTAQTFHTPTNILDNYRDYVHTYHPFLFMEHFEKRLQQEIDYNIQNMIDDDINVAVINLRYPEDIDYIRIKGGSITQ